MKKIVLSILVLLSIEQANAQMVKKITIGELETYISNSKTPLIINFWATFCKPCIEEIPYFIAAATANKNSFEFVMVSLDLPDFYPEKVENFLQKKQFTGATQFWMNETDADSFCPRIDESWKGSMPVTLFVNNKKDFRRFVNQPMTAIQVSQAVDELVR